MTSIAKRAAWQASVLCIVAVQLISTGLAQTPRSVVTVSMQFVEHWAETPRDQRGAPGAFDALSEGGPLEPGRCEEYGGASFYDFESIEQVRVVEQSIQVFRHRLSGNLYLGLGFGERDNRWWNFLFDSYTVGNCLYRIESP